MTDSQVIATLWAGAFLLVHLGVIARVILRPHREPASRVAWIVVMIVLPVTAETVAQWPMTRRLWNKTIAMLGPIL